MSHSKKIVDRLAAAGCVFPKGPPAQAHYKRRGDEPNTWLVRREKIGSSEYLVDEVPWLFGKGTETPSSGHEIILDVQAAELARTPCLVGYTPNRDLWDLHLTSLDGFASLVQALTGPRIEFVGWNSNKRPAGPVGHYCNVFKYGRCQGIIVEVRYFGQPGVDPQAGVRVANQSRGVEWIRLSEVEVGREIGVY